MEETKLASIMAMLFTETEKEESFETTKAVLQSLIGEDVKYIKDLWFEATNIKKDENYYEIILTFINIIFESLINDKIFNINKLAKEIVQKIEKSPYAIYYKIVRQIFLMVDQKEKSYYDIYCSVICLGFKKDSILHDSLVFNLKDLCEYDILSDNPYSIYLKDFNYEFINLDFLQTFYDFIVAILSDSEVEKKKINGLIESLKGNSDKESNKKEGNDINTAKQKQNNDRRNNNINDIFNKEEERKKYMERIKEGLNSSNNEQEKKPENNNIKNIVNETFDIIPNTSKGNMKKIINSDNNVNTEDNDKNKNNKNKSLEIKQDNINEENGKDKSEINNIINDNREKIKFNTINILNVKNDQPNNNVYIINQKDNDNDFKENTISNDKTKISNNPINVNIRDDIDKHNNNIDDNNNELNNINNKYDKINDVFMKSNNINNEQNGISINEINNRSNDKIKDGDIKIDENIKNKNAEADTTFYETQGNNTKKKSNILNGEGEEISNNEETEIKSQYIYFGKNIY
jgi:hypothetical protein